jgi:hypothetical protein
MFRRGILLLVQGGTVKKRTIIAKIRDNSNQLDAKALELVVGGIPTMTQDSGGHMIIVQGDSV